MLSVRFGESLLAETNAYKLIIEDSVDLAGLPQFVVDMGSDDVHADSLKGSWMFTLHKQPDPFPAVCFKPAVA